MRFKLVGGPSPLQGHQEQGEAGKEELQESGQRFEGDTSQQCVSHETGSAWPEHCEVRDWWLSQVWVAKHHSQQACSCLGHVAISTPSFCTHTCVWDLSSHICADKAQVPEGATLSARCHCIRLTAHACRL